MFGFVRNLLAWAAFVAVFGAPARADIATRNSVNEYITQKWGITLGRDAKDTAVIAKSWLMRQIDTANEVLNGTKISDYANDAQYTGPDIVATTVANDAVDNYIRKLEMQFWVVPASSGTTFTINIAAGGMFLIAWGDGVVEKWEKAVGAKDISHTYATGANNYKVYIGGDVTGYPTENNGAIWFGANVERQVREVGGCMGCVFHTIGDGTSETQQPKFHQTFLDNSQLKSIPDGFFFGVRGSGGRRMFWGTFKNSGLTKLPNNLFMGNTLVPAYQMFNETFYGCENLAGSIPGSLFSGLVGSPSEYMFDNTFHDCKKLTGEIPGNLFEGISGLVATKMYNGTFYGCSGLTGEIPSDLFKNVYGDARPNMFEMTFSGCSGLTSIGADLFGDITGGPQGQMFDGTFYGCSSLTGPSATVGTGENKEYIYQRWPNVDDRQAKDCYVGAGGLDDYDCIPTNWGGPGIKEPGTCVVGAPKSDAAE